MGPRTESGFAGILRIRSDLIGLIWHDFAAVWQPIDNLIGFDRPVVASLYAFAFLAAGIATMIPRAARFGLPVLVVLHLLAALGWVPRVIGHAMERILRNAFLDHPGLRCLRAPRYIELHQSGANDCNRSHRVRRVFAVVRHEGSRIGHLPASM